MELNLEEVLQKIAEAIDQIRERLDELDLKQEEIIEKLANLSTYGVNYSVEDE